MSIFHKLSTIKVGKKFHFNEGELISFVNPFSYCALKKQDVTSIDRWCVDGILAVKVFKLFGLNIERNSFDFTSLAHPVFEYAEKHSLTIAFVGSKQNEIEGFVDYISKRYTNLRINSFHSGYFCVENSRDRVINKLKYDEVDMVIVGMGTPLQEQFLIDLQSAGWKGTGFTCGGFFHQTASASGSYYPRWIDLFNLRWLYRMWDEPKLIPRYLKYYPLFLITVIKDFLLFRLKNENK